MKIAVTPQTLVDYFLLNQVVVGQYLILMIAYLLIMVELMAHLQEHKELF